MITKHFTSIDGHQLAVHYQTVDTPRATIVIAHGMAEHGMRYQRFANDLNAAGLNLVALDLRGHGQTSQQNGVRGSFGPGGYQAVITDLEAIITDLRSNEPDLPVILFGHSMGSMLALRIAQRQRIDLNAVIISAFPIHPGLLVHAGKIMGKLMSRLQGSETPSKFMDNLTFGKFNKAIANRRTDFDWLSRVENEVDAYIADPNCGEVFSNGFFYELASLTDTVHRNLHALHQRLNLLYIAGDDDPVVGKAKGFRKNAKALRKYVPQLETRLYTGGRHELLNDQCRADVVTDCINFIDRSL